VVVTRCVTEDRTIKVSGGRQTNAWASATDGSP